MQSAWTHLKNKTTQRATATLFTKKYFLKLFSQEIFIKGLAFWTKYISADSIGCCDGRIMFVNIFVWGIVTKYFVCK